MREWWSKVQRALGMKPDLGRELQQEMDAHLQFLIDENLDRGIAPNEARAAALREFGNMTAVQERSYESWQFLGFESILRDFRYALRGFARSPAFSLIVVLTLAVGIGANTAVFSVLYTVILKSLPYPAAERLVWLGESNAKATGISVTWLNFQQWRKDNRSFETMAGFQNIDMTLTGRGQAILTRGGLVTSQFFTLTGSHPTMGRLFTDSDDQPQSPATVVVTQSFWAKTLSADSQIVGKTITLNGSGYEVIGVLGRDPGFFLRPVDYYLPLRPTVAQTAKRDAHGSMRVLALLKPGVTLAQARSDLDTILKRLALSDPGPENDHRTYAEFLATERTGSVLPVFELLVASAFLVLLLACANIGCLLLIRMTTRAREMAVRTAIGAARSRLVQQLVLETLFIALFGGAVGLLIAYFGLRFLVKFGPDNIPRLSEAGLSIPALLFAGALTLAVALVCALAPVFSSAHVSLSILLKDSRSGAGTNRFGHAIRSCLVIAEIAMAVILLFTSGILLRSLWAVESKSPGFDAGNLLALELQLPSGQYNSDTAILDFYDRLKTQLRAKPGIDSVGEVNCPPAGGDCGDWWYSVVEKTAPARDEVPLTLINMADTQYFNTMRIPLLAGRAPSDQDRAGGPPVAVINQELAHAWWSDARAAVGHHIKLGGPYRKGPVLEIVGVVANVPQLGLDAEVLPEIYFPAAQRISPGMVIAIRASSASDDAMKTIRKTVAAIDRDVPIQSLKPFDQRIGASLAQRRFVATLLALFAGIAVLLAAIGCYGVLNYWVASRKQEIAIRMALGASALAIMQRTGGQAAKLALVGTGLGLAACWGASRWIRSLVFGVSSHDPLAIGIAGLMAISLVVAAAALPIWRAIRVDPIETLHEA